MPRVKFLTDHTTKSNPEDRQSFEKGSIHEMGDASARHFVSRGLARLATDDDEDESAAAAKPRRARAAEPAATPQTGSKPTDYDSWTLADLHAEAAKRNLEGRSAMDKAGLVKALQKSDKG